MSLDQGQTMTFPSTTVSARAARHIASIHAREARISSINDAYTGVRSVVSPRRVHQTTMRIPRNDYSSLGSSAASSGHDAMMGIVPSLRATASERVMTTTGRSLTTTARVFSAIAEQDDTWRRDVARAAERASFPLRDTRIATTAADRTLSPFREALAHGGVDRTPLAMQTLQRAQARDEAQAAFASRLAGGGSRAVGGSRAAVLQDRHARTSTFGQQHYRATGGRRRADMHVPSALQVPQIRDLDDPRAAALRDRFERQMTGVQRAAVGSLQGGPMVTDRIGTAIDRYAQQFNLSKFMPSEALTYPRPVDAFSDATQAPQIVARVLRELAERDDRPAPLDLEPASLSLDIVDVDSATLTAETAVAPTGGPVSSEISSEAPSEVAQLTELVNGFATVPPCP